MDFITFFRSVILETFTMSYTRTLAYLHFQTLTPDCQPLVEALLHDLLATTHNLKLCKENKKGWDERTTRSTGNESPRTPMDNQFNGRRICEAVARFNQIFES